MSKCSRRHLQYFYHASAYGLAGEIERPTRYSIPMQAATTLAGSGGRGYQRVERFTAQPFVSFDAAYTEVGGSFDDCHNQHTTFAYSVIEGLNIAGMITADRIVARMAIYSPKMDLEDANSESAAKPAAATKGKRKQAPAPSPDAEAEHMFDITGSYFENLRIAGLKIDVQLATHQLHQNQTYQNLATAMESSHELQPWGNLDKERLDRLEEMEEYYHALEGFGSRAKRWRDDTTCRCMNGMYWLSAAGHYNLNEEHPESELHGFGGIICIPKFGVVRLAEITAHHHRRELHMLRVDMCSTSDGNIVGGGAGGGGTGPN